MSDKYVDRFFVSWHISREAQEIIIDRRMREFAGRVVREAELFQVPDQSGKGDERAIVSFFIGSHPTQPNDFGTASAPEGDTYTLTAHVLKVGKFDYV